jgi:hypothetical protein
MKVMRPDVRRGWPAVTPVHAAGNYLAGNSYAHGARGQVRPKLLWSFSISFELAVLAVLPSLFDPANYVGKAPRAGVTGEADGARKFLLRHQPVDGRNA